MDYNSKDEDLCKKYPHFERIIDERFVLGDKVDKLHKFIDGTNGFKALPKEEQEMLEEQLPIMRDYLDILDKRISYYRDNK